jgi:undecaprenyl-diphosphatase
MRTTGHTPGSERVVRAFSNLGECGALWIGLGLATSLLGAPEHRRPRLKAGAVAGGGFLLNWGLKQVVRRPRPKLEGLPPIGHTVSGLSFPSAHATASFAGASLLSETLPAAPLYAAAVAMAASRPWLGVHYPSDVVAGAVLGTAVAEIVR